jgi:hypothetical protein
MPQNKNLTQICFSTGGTESKMGLSMQEKKALTREASKRYQKARKKDKELLLSARYRPPAERRQEKACPQGEKRDKTGETPEKADTRPRLLRRR